MADEKKKVWVEALKRFNHHNPGEVFDVDPDDAEYWKAQGLVKMSKGPKEPPADKAKKEGDVTK